jgi:4-hydroxybenzoate polyprenyltransferase
MRPLCVDLDGTLLKTDLLFESLLQLLKRRWWALFLLPVWLLGGKARLKREIASRIDFDGSGLPMREEVLALIRAARDAGRPVVLATASDRSLVQPLAQAWGLFDQVEASDGERNLGGREKARRLVALYGEKGFDYVGDHANDLPVWASAGAAVVVSQTASLVRRAQAVCGDVTWLRQAPAGVRPYAKALRLHQWLKNLLVFVPALAAHRTDASTVTAALLCFLSFGLCASAVYLLNDLLDLPSDRVHHRKRRRPFAAGALPLAKGLLLIPLCLAGAIAVAAWLPPAFALVLAGYFAVTCLYSFWLKNQVVVDVLLLALLYTSRILAGSAATRIEPTFWLLALSLFAFLSLALVKRYSELLVVLRQKKQAAAGRGYRTDDLPVLLSLGTSAAFMAVMVLALYIREMEGTDRYLHPQALWLVVPPFLYWMTRVWMKTHRGEMHDDPVVFAASDRQSWVVGAVLLLGFLVAAG